MPNIMSMLKLSNKPKKNGFDLSRKNAFTAKVGELLPVCTIHTLPNSEYDINISSFTRTMPLNTAAYIRLKEYYDFYFVPLRLLYRYAPQMIAQNNEYMFATSANDTPSLGTRFPYIDRHSLVSYSGGFSDTDVLGYSFKSKFSKLCEYLGYGDVSSIPGTEPTAISLFPLFAYQKIYQDYFRDSQWETSDARSYNIDYVSPGTLLTPSVWLNNTFFQRLLQLRYCNYPTDYFQGLLPNSQYGDAAIVDGNAGYSSGQTVTVDGKQYLTLYENTSSQTSVPAASTGSVFVASYKDSAGSGTGTNQMWRTNDEVSYTGSAKEYLIPAASASTFSILALRKAEAAQRYKEIVQSNSKDYPSQMRAVYGSSTPDSLGSICQYLGGTSGNIVINDVDNTNLSDASSSVNIKGKGVGNSDGHIHFRCEEHGIIMGIYHAVPLLDYAPVGLSKFNTKVDVTDIANPLFDSIGMQPTYQYELIAKGYNGYDPKDTIVGYAPRYAEYKTGVDEIHGAFFNGGLDAWTTPFQYVVFKTGELFNNWMLLKKVNPSIMDTVFAAAADSTVQTDQLLINSFFDIKAVLPLDRNGLPY